MRLICGSVHGPVTSILFLKQNMQRGKGEKEKEMKEKRRGRKRWEGREEGREGGIHRSGTLPVRSPPILFYLRF